MTLPKPHVTKDSFFHQVSLTSPSDSSPSSPWPTTIYFITGNPGLISYYHTFLSLLGKKLLAALPEDSKNAIHITGHSLAGFELEPGTKTPEHYHDVEDQICFVLGKLDGHMRALREDPAFSESPVLDDKTQGQGPGLVSRPRPRVILVGHSLGTYMAMEIIRRHRERQAEAEAQGRGGDDGTNDFDFDITGGIMLFPTVMDLASSPSGQKFGVLRLIPHLALVISLFARLLTMLLPTSILRAVIGYVMHSPPQEAIEGTASFLKSKRGVRQALHMAADELRVISSDKWSDDVWGVSVQQQPPSRLYFYFGRDDHWVAERTREKIIAARAVKDSEQSGPRMFVCEENVPHAFCLRHNEIMATKVADMVQKLLE